MATLFARQALLADGWAANVRLACEGGLIRSVERDATPQPQDDLHAAVLPGMPNLHSHAFQRAFAGQTERRGSGEDSFWTWREAMYATALALEPEDVEVIAAQLYIEMLESGFTRVGEFHYLHHARDGSEYANIAEMAERIAGAAARTGIGLTLLPVFYAYAGFGALAPQPGQRRFITRLDRYERLYEASEKAIAGLAGARLGVAPHSLRAATPGEIREISRFSGRVAVHIHVAEQVREVEECMISTGMRPVELLIETQNINQDWCLIHATHMTRQEAEHLSQTGTVAGLCPITEANLGDGLFNIKDFFRWHTNFGIGSDSNVEIGPWAELRLLEYGQRLTRRKRNAIVAPERSSGGFLYQQAVAGGARALGVEDIGLAPKHPADFITIRPAHPDWDMPEGDAILDSLIFAPGSLAVDCVYVAGDRLVENGRHRAREGVARAFGKVMRRLRER